MESSAIRSAFETIDTVGGGTTSVDAELADAYDVTVEIENILAPLWVFKVLIEEAEQSTDIYSAYKSGADWISRAANK